MSRLPNVTLIQLEYLVALDKYRHFIQAAEASFVTQPTLSMQIKKLEESLDVKLFDRSRQPIVPTEIGKAIIEQAKTIINETRRLEDVLLRHTDSVIGELHIGIIPTVAPYIMPLFIHRINKAYPDLTLHVKEMMTHEIIEALKKSDLDLGLLATPLDSDNLKEKPIFYEGFCAYLHPTHPFYREKDLPITALLEDRLWLLSEGNCFRTQTLNLCGAGIKQSTGVNLSYESGSLDTLMRIVNMEGGGTIIPQWASLQLPEEFKKHMRPISDVEDVREVSLVHKASYSKERLTEAVLETLKSCVPPEIQKKNPGHIVPIT
jgi:LysR family hydrogen peroxide-inducible transcriptional activator